jgi:N-formylglutamate amidohydrolase
MTTEYFRVERPTEQTLPIVVDVPHAGEWVPEELADKIIAGTDELKRDLDLYTDRIWAGSVDVGATMIASSVSRYVVDLNRASDDVCPQTVVGGKRIDRPGYYQERGVVWRNTTDGTPVMAGPMFPDAFERRIERFWAPYHRALAEEIERVKAVFGYCILVDGHSMPSMGRSGHSDPDSRRADIVPGDVRGTSCAAQVTTTVISHFEGHDFTVKPNLPYRGGWITRHYGRPEDDVHAIQIEVNRDLYMDERTFRPREKGLRRVADACVALLPKLAGTPLS